MSEAYEDWCSGNEQRAYPIQEDVATPFPRSLLTDLRLLMPGSSPVYVTQLYVSAYVVSIALSDAAGNGVACGTFARAGLRAHVPQPLVGVAGGVHGTVTFGQLPPTELRVAGNWSLDFRTIVSVGPMPVTSLRPESEAVRRTGLLNVVAGGYLELSVEDGELWFRLRPGAEGLFGGSCSQVTQGSGCPVPPTRQISGVAPNADGVLYLRFT